MRFDPTGMTPEQIAEMNRLNDELYGGGPSKPPSPGPIPEPPPVTTISDPGPVPAGFGNEGFGDQSQIGAIDELPPILGPISPGQLPINYNPNTKPAYDKTPQGQVYLGEVRDSAGNIIRPSLQDLTVTGMGPSLGNLLPDRGMPFPPRPFPPYYGGPFPPPRPQPMGIGSLFSQLAYMPEEQFSRNLGRFQQFNEQYGGLMSPNINRGGRLRLFNQLGGLTDDQFTMGMDRLSQYRNVFDPQPQPGTPQGIPQPPAVETSEPMPPPMYADPRPNPYANPSYTGSFGQPRNPYFGGGFGGGMAGRGLYGAGMAGRDLMGGGMGMGYGAFGGGGYYQPSAPPSNSASIGGKGGAEPAGGGGKGGGV